MTALAIDLREAGLSVAVANTPIFLARRLLENAAVRQAHQLHGAEKIFAALQKISARKPSDLNEAAEAYFYLVALSLDDNKLWLRRAGALSAPHVKWFADVADYLLGTARATVISSVHAPTTLTVPSKIIIDGERPRNATANTSHVIRL
jgi:hypothetical protein